MGVRRHGPAPEGADYVEFPPGFAKLLRAGLGDLSPLIAPLRTRGVRLIHAHFAPDAIIALPLARALGVPLITTLHGFDVTRTDASLLASGRWPLIRSVLERRRLWREGAAFVAVSAFIAEQACANGAPADRLHVLPIGVDTLALRPRGEPEPGLIVHVGRLVEKKGAAVLLDALAKLSAAGSPARLEIVGDGPLRGALTAQAARLGIADHVTFHDALSHADTLAVIRRAALLAVPSLPARDGDREGLPTVIPEAFALGVPVVASREAGIGEAVEDGVNGLLVPPGEPSTLAAALRRALADESLRARLAIAARQTAEQRFDLARQTAALEALYDRVTAETAP